MKKNQILIAMACVLSLVVAMTACSEEPVKSDIPRESGKDQESSNKVDKTSNTIGIRKQTVSNEVYAAEEHPMVTEANTAFAFDLFREVNQKKAGSNVFISPFSISAALGMAYNGAQGSTKEAIAEALGLAKLTDEEYNQGQKFLYDSLNGVTGAELDVSNSIWIRESYEVEQAFIDTNKEVFDAFVKTLDFQSDNAAGAMNDWISDNTNGLIDQMIEPPIDPMTMLFLINTIYFKGEWQEKFDEDNTIEKNFNGYNSSAQVDMMHHYNKDFLYFQNESYRAVKLYYGDGETAMVCILPEKTRDVNELIDTFNESDWETINKGMLKQTGLPVQLPAFEIEYGIESLNEPLKALGMDLAFDPQQADFGGIHGNPDQKLYVDSVMHKAVIKVNEEGAEAAAATTVEMKTTSIVVDPAMFIADRPFMFFITDEQSDSILFMGKVDEL